ncbi:hypothetical protein V8E36_001134 [Tilletia maclaganii]
MAPSSSSKVVNGTLSTLSPAIGSTSSAASAAAARAAAAAKGGNAASSSSSSSSSALNRIIAGASSDRLAISDEELLMRYSDAPPSFAVHLHPEHFRLDKQVSCPESLLR